MLLELHSPEVADAQADYAKAQAQVTLAEHAFRRQQELYQGKVVSRKDLEQAEDDLSQARSEVQRAQNRLKICNWPWPKQCPLRFAFADKRRGGGA